MWRSGEVLSEGDNQKQGKVMKRYGRVSKAMINRFNS